MKIKYKLLVLKTKKGEPRIQFYLDWWAEAWREKGGECKYECFVKPRVLFAILGRIFNFRVLPTFGRRLIVLAGHRIERVAWPWNMFYEIIPIMWDICPGRSMKLKRGKVKMEEYILQIYNSTRLNRKCKMTMGVC